MLSGIFKNQSKDVVEVNMLLSMSKLAGSSQEMMVRQQTPQDCLEMIKQIRTAFPSSDIRINFVYTDSLYLNKNELASKVAERVVLQMARHQKGFEKLAGDEHVGFLSWNQVLLNSSANIESAFSAMRTRYQRDSQFAELVRSDTLAAKTGKVPTEQDIEFILQELVVLEMIRRTNSNADKVIIAYPGEALKSDIYLRDSKRPHPLGKAKPVTHKAYWADIGEAENIELDEFTLPQVEKLRPSHTTSWITGLAASFAACLAVVADNPDTLFVNNHSTDPVISVQEDGIIKMQYSEAYSNKVAYLYSDLDGRSYHQILMRNGKQDPIANRDAGYEAYRRLRLVDEYLERHPL